MPFDMSLKNCKNTIFLQIWKNVDFHKDEVRFLGYIILAQGIKIEEKQIVTVKNWLELKSV